MATRPRVINLSECNMHSQQDEEEEPIQVEEKLNRSAVMGRIVEKGFCNSTQGKVSAPKPRAVAFPVARHRSQGPYWPPPSKLAQSTSTLHAEQDESPGVVEFAQSLRRRKDSFAVGTGHSPCNAGSEPASRQALGPSSSNGEDSGLSKRNRNTAFEVSGHAGVEVSGKESKSMFFTVSQGLNNSRSEGFRLVNVASNASATASVQGSSLEIKESLALSGSSSASEFHSEGKEDCFEEGVKKMSGSRGDLEYESIHNENMNTIRAMTAAEFAEAQAKLSQLLTPSNLEMLKRRGSEKERKRLVGAANVAMEVGDEGTTKKIHGDPIKNSLVFSDSKVDLDLESASGKSICDSRSVLLEEEMIKKQVLQTLDTQESAPSDLWRMRVEAIRLLRFDLDGNVPCVGTLIEKPETELVRSSESIAHERQDQGLSVVERDMLRTDGDPAGSGYTFREALTLVRSTVPGQRSVSMRLVWCVLRNALHGLRMQHSKPKSLSDLKGAVDWQAVWAYALGPEAQLVLTLRLALDDGHSTVIGSCARALQALLSYAANESFFEALEGSWPGDNVVYTAPIFRKKTKYDEGFIGCGRWKYNVKRTEMFPLPGTTSVEQVEEEEEDTVGDDGHVASKDVAAGLVRMGVLPRLRYILEEGNCPLVRAYLPVLTCPKCGCKVDGLNVADDAFMCILISLARHSFATCAAVMYCPRLISTVLHRFVFEDGEKITSSSCQLKAIRLLKVLSQSRKSFCQEFEKLGVLEALLRPFTQQSSREAVSSQDFLRRVSSKWVEVLRFWRVCLGYGIGVSFFTETYQTLCVFLWPFSEKDHAVDDVDGPFSLSLESYRLLESFGRTLPVLQDKTSSTLRLDDGRWSWSIAVVMVNTAIKWLSPGRISTMQGALRRFLEWEGEMGGNRDVLKMIVVKNLRVLSSILHFLATVCEKIVAEDDLEQWLGNDSSISLPWLPTFVPHLGLAIAESGLVNAARSDICFNMEKRFPLLDLVCFCCQKRENDCVLAGVNCQLALVRVSNIVDKLVSISKRKGVSGPQDQRLSYTVLHRGLVASAGDELKRWMYVTGNAVTSRSKLIDANSRGGPAPGVGVGWGSLLGGLFSKDILVAHASARLNLELLNILPSLKDRELDTSRSGDIKAIVFDPLWRISTGLALAAVASPPIGELLKRGLSITIFHPVSLSFMMEKVEGAVKGWNRIDPDVLLQDTFQISKLFEFSHLGRVLIKHFEAFWLRIKHRDADEFLGELDRRPKSKLAAVYEDDNTGNDDRRTLAFTVEYAGQRLPLPPHWYMSPFVGDVSIHPGLRTGEHEEVLLSGLAFFLGIEVLKAEVPALGPIVPLERKIHSLSCVFLTGSDIYFNSQARHLIGALQDVIGRQVAALASHRHVESECTRTGISMVEVGRVEEATGPAHCGASLNFKDLDFEGKIDPSYVALAEGLAEQFGASSFGNVVFGRQVALYLCSSVREGVRLATWRVLADAKVLDLLPALSLCCGIPANYLNPPETNQKMLEAYASDWASGALDKSASNDSLPFTLALHHLGGFLFDQDETVEVASLKKKYARTLIRSCLHRPDRQVMLGRLLSWTCSPQTSGNAKNLVKARLGFFAEACGGDTSLLAEIQRMLEGE